MLSKTMPSLLVMAAAWFGLAWSPLAVQSLSKLRAKHPEGCVATDMTSSPDEFLVGTKGSDGVYRTENGSINLRSDAPLEVIEARSRKLRGAIDPTKQSFAWSVEIKSFEGFNSPLQREHFNENYLETNRYPRATFQGKIIEQLDFTQDGTYNVRAKGKLKIHGVEQERIIRSVLVIKGKKVHVTSSFTVPLTDHDITIPKIVYQKIAEEVTVKVDADLVE